MKMCVTLFVCLFVFYPCVYNTLCLVCLYLCVCVFYDHTFFSISVPPQQLASLFFTPLPLPLSFFFITLPRARTVTHIHIYLYSHAPFTILFYPKHTNSCFSLLLLLLLLLSLALRGRTHHLILLIDKNPHSVQAVVACGHAVVRQDDGFQPGDIGINVCFGFLASFAC